MWCFTLLPSSPPSHQSPQTRKMPQNNRKLGFRCSLLQHVTFKFILLTSPNHGKANPPFSVTLVHPGFWVPHSCKGHGRQAGKKLARYVGVGCMVLRIRMRRETYCVTWAWGRQWCQILSCSAKAKLGCCSGCLSLFIYLVFVWWSFGELSGCMCCLWWCWLRILMVDCSLQLTFWFHVRGVRVSKNHLSQACIFSLSLYHGYVSSLAQQQHINCSQRKRGKVQSIGSLSKNNANTALTSVLFNF